MYRYRISYCLVASFDAVSNNIPNSCNLNVRLVFMLLWMRRQFGNLSWNIRACDVCLCVCVCDKRTTRISILKFELLKIYRQQFIGSIQTMRSLCIEHFALIHMPWIYYGCNRYAFRLFAYFSMVFTTPMHEVDIIFEKKRIHISISTEANQNAWAPEFV